MNYKASNRNESSVDEYHHTCLLEPKIISQNYVTPYNRKTHKALHPKKNYQLKNSTTPYQQEHPEGITSKGELLLALYMSLQTAI